MTFVIDPPTTVPATIPSKVSSASVDVRRPRTKGRFFSAHLPFFNLPEHQDGVLSSFDTSSRNPSCSGVYCMTLSIKSALHTSFLSHAIHFSFSPTFQLGRVHDGS
jgi:hypothetical protein